MDRQNIDQVREFYDNAPEVEWDRLERQPFEFELTTYMMDKYIKPGDSLLDIGGGPGRYSIHYAKKGCAEVLSGNASFVILCCGTGVGISIAANKLHGIRCGLCPSPEIAALVKQHNNANAIALGGRFTEPALAKEIVEAYMNAEFMGGRHQTRVDKISALEA